MSVIRDCERRKNSELNQTSEQLQREIQKYLEA
jgi:hypothetical protein